MSGVTLMHDGVAVEVVVAVLVMEIVEVILDVGMREDSGRRCG